MWEKKLKLEPTDFRVGLFLTTFSFFFFLIFLSAIYWNFTVYGCVSSAWADGLGFSLAFFFLGILILNLAFKTEQQRISEWETSTGTKDEEIIARLNKLKILLEGGYINEDDYEEKKREILRGL